MLTIAKQLEIDHSLVERLVCKQKWDNLLLHVLSFKRRSLTSTWTLKTEKNAFIMVQMWPADSQLSGGHPYVVRCISAAFGGVLQRR